MRQFRPRTWVLIAIAGALIAALLASAYPRDIDANTATAMAERMLVQYRRMSGEPAIHFDSREGRRWADGWEFRWRYRLCPDAASLRIWISRDGRRASFAEVPDCSGESGFAKNPVAT